MFTFHRSVSGLALLIVVVAMMFSGVQPVPALAQGGKGRAHPNGANMPLLAGVTWYVATTGDDTDDCLTTTTPCLTINGAIGKASADDTILVATGTYTGSGNEVVLVDKSLTLSGGWNASFTTQSGKSTIDGQSARRGVTVNLGVSVTFEYMSLQNGLTTVSPGGGGILNEGTLTINNSVISSNTASFGGGGILNNGTLTLNASVVDGNSNGGLYNNGSVTVSNSTVSNNIDGGFRNGGILTINNSTINGNSHSYYTAEGGGIWSSGTLAVSNSTVSGNTAAGGRGGGIANDGNATISNSTITNNTTAQGGGISNLYGTSLILKNSIVFGNNAVTGPDCYDNHDYGGLITSSGYNIIGNPVNCTYTSSAGDLTNVDANLSPLADNGGLTLTHSLGVNSPAINAGNPEIPGSGGNACLVTDQRGVARPVGSRCDIGAYEGGIIDLTNIIEDPSFEAYTPNPYWSETSTNFGTPLCTLAVCGNGNGTAGPRTGNAWGWFGGVPAPYLEAASLSQVIAIPATVYSLQFYFRIGSAAPDSTASDVFTAAIDGVPVFTANATQQGLYAQYTLVGVDIKAFANGGMHTLTFSSNTTHLVNFNLDDIALSEAAFADVPSTHPYYNDIQILYANGYTGGCSTAPLLFCPDLVMNRAQTAVFMLRGNFGSAYTPVTPTHFFADSWAGAPWAEGWAESMFLENLTGGCLLSPLMFCPYDQLTKAQAAVFGLRLKYGTTHVPPVATGTVFADMTDVTFWALPWAEQAYADGLIPSCGTDVGSGKPLFCPNNLVDRGFGANIIVKAKGLTP